MIIAISITIIIAMIIDIMISIIIAMIIAIVIHLIISVPVSNIAYFIIPMYSSQICFRTPPKFASVHPPKTNKNNGNTTKAIKQKMGVWMQFTPKTNKTKNHHLQL